MGWFGPDLTDATIAPGAQVIAPPTVPGHQHLSLLDLIIEELPW